MDYRNAQADGHGASTERHLVWARNGSPCVPIGRQEPDRFGADGAAKRTLLVAGRPTATDPVAVVHRTIVERRDLTRLGIRLDIERAYAVRRRYSVGTTRSLRMTVQ